MQPIIQLALTLLEQVLPQLAGANAPLLTKISEGLAALVPLLVKEFQDALPFIKNVIAMLKNHTEVSQEQLQALSELETQIDAAFEAAAATALADDTFI